MRPPLSLSAFFLVSFSLASLMSHIDARGDPGEYWRSVMKDEPMPKAILDVLNLNPDEKAKEEDHFIRNFDTKPNLIIYHSHVVYNQDHHNPAPSSSSSSSSSSSAATAELIN